MAQDRKDELLDHDADGIQEYDNSLPRWWLYGFYFTIIFSIAYMVHYHVAGTGKLMSAEYEEEVQAAASTKKMAEANAPKKELPTSPLTDAASLKKGQEIFESANSLCSTCHRTDLGGQVGPNLTDEFWIHGCDLQTIMKNITTGFPEKGMLPYGSTNKLSDEQLLQVASYVLSKQGSNPPDPKPIEPERDVKCGANATSEQSVAATTDTAAKEH